MDDDDENTCSTCRHSFFPTSSEYGWCLENDGCSVCGIGFCMSYEKRESDDKPES